MPIEFQCSNCQKLLRVPDTSAGKNAKCPACDSIMVIPGTSSTRPASELSAAEPAPQPNRTDEPAAATPNPYAEMDSNPYAASTASAPPYMPAMEPLDRDVAARRVRGPALGLLIGNGLTVAFWAFVVVANAVDNSGGAEEIVSMALGAFILSVFPLLITIGAIFMLRLRLYGVALAACILGCIPCAPCWILTIGFSIWGLVVLSDAGVKGAFR